MKSKRFSVILGLVIATSLLSGCDMLAKLFSPTTTPEQATTPEKPISDYETRIPDAALRAAMESAVGKTFAAGITATDLKAIQAITAKKVGIKSLTGIGLCENLVRLNLNGNELSDVSPLASCARLESLSLQMNDITDPSPLATIHSIKYISLAWNPISYERLRALLTSTNFPHLSSLILEGYSGNSDDERILTADQAATILGDFKGLREMWLMDLDDMTPEILATVMSDRREVLEGLSLSNCSITSDMIVAHVLDLTRLTELDLSNNAFGPLPQNASQPAWLATLEYLNFSDCNKFGSINFLLSMYEAGSFHSDDACIDVSRMGLATDTDYLKTVIALKDYGIEVISD